MKQRFKTGVGAFVLCVALLLAGALPVCAVGAHPVPDSGMTLDTSELLLELTSEDPAPVAYLTVHAPNDYFFLIWTSSAPSVASVDGTGKVTGHSEGTASITACNERGEKNSLHCDRAQKHSSPPGAEHHRAGADHYGAGACAFGSAEAGTERQRVHLCAAVGEQQPFRGTGEQQRNRDGPKLRQSHHQRTDDSRAGAALHGDSHL